MRKKSCNQFSMQPTIAEVLEALGALPIGYSPSLLGKQQRESKFAYKYFQ